MWDLFLLIAGAVLGVIATKVDDYFKRRGVMKRNLTSLKILPEYNPINDDILLLRQWNSKDKLDEQKAEIIYDKNRAYDLKYPNKNVHTYLILTNYGGIGEGVKKNWSRQLCNILFPRP